MYIIGVTGGIACGKSVVSYEIKKYGAAVISADKLAHALSEPGREIFSAYVRHFGTSIINEDGTMNRKVVADIVFNDKVQRKWIDDTTHPILLNCVRDMLVEFQNQGYPIAVLDVPLLFEAGWDVLADEVWVVQLKRKKQVGRLMRRNGLTYDEAAARINAQMGAKEKYKRADVIINNSMTRAMTRAQIFDQMKIKFPHLINNYLGLIGVNSVEI